VIAPKKIGISDRKLQRTSKRIFEASSSVEFVGINTSHRTNEGAPTLRERNKHCEDLLTGNIWMILDGGNNGYELLVHKYQTALIL